ncbi:MAG: hypothetical protein PV340_05135 [Wolbachia sp.]|nr:hypothetical protein [Wolbachia sp.]MDD9336209.1 hypothetical protein [Wolbachia sp.]
MITAGSIRVIGEIVFIGTAFYLLAVVIELNNIIKEWDEILEQQYKG